MSRTLADYMGLGPAATMPQSGMRGSLESYMFAEGNSATSRDFDRKASGVQLFPGFDAHVFEDVPSPDSFSTTLELDRGQQIGLQAAKTEVRRGEQRIRRAGMTEEYEEYLAEDEPGTFSTLIDPVFDLLQIGQFTVVGATQEYLRTGSGWEALKQAGLEFGNALPGIDLRDRGARRPSFTDVLEESGNGRLSSAVGGFMLDVILDPTTYLGIGALGRILATSGKAVGGATGLSRLAGGVVASESVQNSIAVAQRLLVPRGALKNLGPEGEALIPHLQQAESAVVNGLYDVRETTERIFASATAEERALIGVYLDQPETLSKQIDALAERGAIGRSRVAELKEKAAAFKQHYDKIWRAEEAEGLVDASIYRDRYLYGVEPTTSRTRRMVDQILDERGLLPPKTKDSVRRSAALKPGDVLRAGQRKSYDTVEDRLMAGVPTEVDIGLNAAKRGFDSTKALVNKHLIDAVIEDPAISARMVDPEILAALERTDDFGQAIVGAKKATGKTKAFTAQQEATLDTFKKQLNDNGYDILTIKRAGGRATKDGPESAVTAAYVLPQEIVSAIRGTDKLFRKSDDLEKVLRGFDKMQGLWKAYALMSPGYHMRNMYSNWFLGWMLGVGRLEGKRGVAGLVEKMPVIGGLKGVVTGEGTDMSRFVARHVQAFKIQLGGKKPVGPVAKALKEMTGLKDIDSVRLPAIKVNGKDASPEDILQWAKEDGVLNQGLFSADLQAEDLEKALMSGEEALLARGGAEAGALKASPGPGDGVRQLTDEAVRAASATGERRLASRTIGLQSPHLRANRAWGKGFENNARLAGYIDQLAKGRTRTEAAQLVKKYYLDYNELSTMDREVFKRVIPFWTWQRKIVPLLFQSMVSDPGRWARVPKVINAIESMSQDWRDIPTPDYFQEMRAIRLPVSRKGKPIYLNPNLPFQDINRLNVQDVMSSLSPFLKAPLGQAIGDRGYSFFLDRPIESYRDEPSEAIPAFFETMGIADLTEGINLTKKGESVLTTAFPTAGKVLRLAQRKVRGELAEQVLTEGLGIKVMPVDALRVVRGNTFARRKLLREFRRKAEAEGRSL